MGLGSDLAGHLIAKVPARMIDEAVYAEEIDLDRTRLRAYVFAHPDGPRVVAWSLHGKQILGLPADEDLVMRNLMGNPIPAPAAHNLILSTEPVYVQAGPHMTTDRLKRLFLAARSTAHKPVNP